MSAKPEFLIESAHVKHNFNTNFNPGVSGLNDTLHAQPITKKKHRKNNFSLQLPQLQFYGGGQHEPLETEQDGSNADVMALDEKYIQIMSNRTRVSSTRTIQNKGLD